MAIKVVCKCGAKFAAREELAGKAIECTACGERVSVPHPAAGGGGIGAGPVIFGLLLLGAAIAGCGYMIYTQQETIKELQSSLDAQRGSIQKIDGTLQAAAERVDGLKEALAASSDEMAAGQLTDEKAIAAVKQQLTDESDRRKTLVTELDRLDTDALRTRADLETAQKARDEAWETLSKANSDKQKEYEVQIEKLQEDMATKADDKAAQDRLAAEVKRLEDARGELVKKANEDRGQLAKYDNRINDLNRQLRAKTTTQRQLQWNLHQARIKLNNIDLTLKKPKLPAQLSTLQKKVDQVARSSTEEFQTLTFDDSWRGQSFWFRLNTATGAVSYSVGSVSNIIRSGPARASWGQKQAPGRYAMQYTVRNSGVLHDLVLLDAQRGQAWSCKVGTGSARSLAWNSVRLIRLHTPGGARKGGKWRISVSRDGGSSQPLLVLTAPDGTVYDDSLMHRRYMFPVSP